MRLALLPLAVASAQIDAQLTVGSRAGGHSRRVEIVYRPEASQAGRSGSSIGVGAALMATSAVLLWWNEGRTLREEQMLFEARRAVRSIDGDKPTLAPEDQLLHITGKLASQGVQDSLIPSVFRPALRLRRVTEAYQWKEMQHTSETRVSATQVRRETSYSYTKGWSARPIDSALFAYPGHENPTPPVEPHTHIVDAADATFAGGLRVPPQLLQQLSDWSQVPLAHVHLDAPPSEGAFIAATAQGDALHFPREARLKEALDHGRTDESPMARVRGAGAAVARPGTIGATVLELPPEVDAYLTEELGTMPVQRLNIAPAPAVGDSRIRFDEIPIPSDGVSVLGSRGPDGIIRPWRCKKHQQTAGPQLYVIRPGHHSGSALLHEVSTSAHLKKWMFRGLGWAMMWLGSYNLLSWLPELANYVPYLGHSLSNVLDVGIAVATLGSSFAMSIMLVAIAWLRFRPLHGALLCAAAPAIMYLHAMILQAINAHIGLPQPAGASA